MNTKTTAFYPNRSRYYYDSKLKGYAHLDTREDKSYFGNWVHPSGTIYTFCEGDETIEKVTDPKAFSEKIRTICKWYQDRNEFIGIDPLNETTRKSFEALGLADLLH